MSLVKESDLQSLSQVSINYLFFGFYFLFVSFIHVYHVFLIEPTLTFATYFFLIYAIVQCAIETLLLVLFANAMKIFFRKKAMALYSLAVFFLLLTHVIDFPLVRFMDMSFWYALNFISAETPQNFLELLYASNVSLFIWILCGVVGFGILFSGIYFYHKTQQMAHKRPLILPYPMLAASLCTLCLFIMTWDYSTHKWARSNYFDLYEKTLPWKSTFFRERQQLIKVAHRLREPPSQEELLKKVPLDALTSHSKPDIFLFVIESLREDYITAEQAPHLFQFKNSNVSFDLALSNANATQISWFSLFSSQYPFYWGRAESKQGSLPLKLLKDIGYKIYCYSAARLNFYEMDRVIFGEKGTLAEEIATFDNNNSEASCQRDRKAIEKVVQEMQTSPSGGRLFILFLDSTHHDYSWPSEQPSYFNPCDKKINFFRAALSNSGLELIKNRYRNSLFYVDSLFGRFIDTLNAYEGKQEAVVVVTADHGEEFYEEGHLFHASGLSHAQMHVPLYYKLGSEKKKAATAMSCHMDIFPTLFHHLTGRDCMQGVLQGQSIFSKERWPYTITARFNGTRSPCEFSLHNGRQKLTASFSDERNIFNAKGLRIISTKNRNGEVIPHNINSIKEQFGEAIDHIFTNDLR
ncbi:MAG TPA: sulfatase-like hydrolase/transferase [Rhabdochlamydiaceae bacterium]|jgi:hypothetical protein